MTKKTLTDNVQIVELNVGDVQLFARLAIGRHDEHLDGDERIYIAVIGRPIGRISYICVLRFVWCGNCVCVCVHM